MPQPKTLAKVKSAKVASNGHIPGTFGAPKTRYRWIECDNSELAGPEGETFRAEVRVSLTGQELLDLSAPTMDWVPLCEMLAPLVIDWNLDGDPPAVTGHAALLNLDYQLIEWLWITIRAARFGGPDRPNSSTPVTPLDDEQADEATASETDD